MALNAVSLPYEYFGDPTEGKPIFDGDIFIGIVDTDPEIVGNQKLVTARQENGTEVPVSQPITIGAGGYPELSGSNVQLLVDGSYSIKVMDRFGSQVFYAGDVTDGVPLTLSNGAEYYDTVADMVLSSPLAGTSIRTRGYTTSGDDGCAEYFIKTAGDFGGAPDEKGDHTLANGNIAVLQVKGMSDVRQYGDDIQAAIDALPAGGGNILCKGKTFTISAPLTWAKSRVGLFGDGVTVNGTGFTSGYMVEPGDESALFTGGGVNNIYFTHDGTPDGIINPKGISNFQINYNRFESGGTACVKSQGCFFLAARGNRINGQFGAGFLFQKAETLGFVSNNSLLENNWIKLNNLSNSIGTHIQDGSQNVLSINNYYEDIGDTLGTAKAIWCDTTGTSPNNLGGVGFSSIDDTFEGCDFIADFDNNRLVIRDPLIGPGNTNGITLDGDGCRVLIQTVTNPVTNNIVDVSATAQFSDITVTNPQSNVSDSGTDTQAFDPRNGRKTIGSFLYKDKVIAKTSDTTVSELDSGALINNEGAAAIVTTTLPALSSAIVGTRYTFVRNQGTFAHRVDPNGTDRIRNGAVIGAAGKYLQLDTNGGNVTLVASTSSFWEVVSEIGANSFEP